MAEEARSWEEGHAGRRVEKVELWKGRKGSTTRKVTHDTEF